MVGDSARVEPEVAFVLGRDLPPLDEVKAQLSLHLMQQNVMKNVDALKAKVRIEVVGAAAPAPAAPASPAAK